MVTDTNIYITRYEPMNVGHVQDQGVQALVLLAFALGWRIRQGPHQPITIIADDGIQKKLPTDTSVRMSVFQTALSTIITHTDDDVVPTVELIDEIIAQTKPSVDHQRRLRLAVGETPQQHRERVENSITPEHRPDPRQEHLMQHIEIPEEPTEEPIEYNRYETADGEEHGELVSREPTKARRSARGGKAQWYESDSSYERHWEDGYVDFECMICGKPNASSRGVGAHIQHHDRPKTEPAWRRAAVTGEDEPEPEQEKTVPVVLVEEPSTAQQTLDKVIQLVVPTLLRERDRLKTENAALREENERLTRDWTALKDLIGGR